MSKVLFIVNPAAGKGRALKLVPDIEKCCKHNYLDYEIQYTTGPKDGIRLAKYAVDNDFKRVIAVGGDGTVNEVVNGVVGSDIAVGAIPGGSGNDFFRSINKHKNMEQIIEDNVFGDIDKIDVGRCNDMYFINVGSVGFDAQVVIENRNMRKVFSGSLSYLAALIKTILTYKGVKLNIKVDNNNINTNALLVAMANGKYYGGGMMPAPDADIRDGKYDVCIIRQLPKIVMLILMPLFIKGKHGVMKQVTFYRGEKAVITSEKSFPVNIDGETFIHNNVKFEIFHKMMNVIFPKNDK